MLKEIEIDREREREFERHREGRKEKIVEDSCIKVKKLD